MDSVDPARTTAKVCGWMALGWQPLLAVMVNVDVAAAVGTPLTLPDVGLNASPAGRPLMESVKGESPVAVTVNA
jgi:hypothetical protein